MLLFRCVVLVDLAGVSSLQAQIKDTQAAKLESWRLNDLLTARNKETNELKQLSHELEEQRTTLHQQLRGHLLNLLIIESHT